MKEFAEKFYASKAWHDTRRAFIAERRRIDGGLCQMCHDRLGVIVHHRTELTPGNINDPGVTLAHRNLQFVCRECHNEHHGYFTGAAEPFEFDAEGNFHPRPPQSPRGHAL